MTPHAARGDVEQVMFGAPSRSYTESVRLLLERDAELARLLAAADGARGGQGAGVALTGESGAGKSTLVQSLTDRATGLRLMRGQCDPLSTPRPLGPFRDLASAGLLPSLRTGTDVVLPEVCEQVYDAVRDEPTVLVVEDLHWADAASVEVLRFVARRVEAMPLLLVVTYRDGEIGPRHPARALLGDFARLDGLARVPLAPLSLAAVRQLLDGTPLDPGQVHRATGGNPFFVCEVAKDPGLPVPSSVRDAVLARTADVDPHDFEVLQLVASAPDRLDDRLLPVLGVDLPTLRRLDETGLLSRDPGGIVFRHELARQAVESTIPPGGGPRLHARLLHALSGLDSVDPAVLTHHAVSAHENARASLHARAAAEEAIRSGAHSEAAAFFEIALEYLDTTSARERAALLLSLSFEQYMTSRLTEAIANVTATFPLWEEVGDREGLAAAHDAVAIYEYYNARRSQAEQHADQATVIASAAGATLPFANARATRAFLAYLRSEDGLVREVLEDPKIVTERASAPALGVRTALLESLTLLVTGDHDARADALASVERARSAGFDELASTGYSQVSSLDVEQGRFRAAERVLEESLPFTHDRDIPICRHFQTATRSRLNLAQGHWSAALEDAGAVLEHEGMPVATLWPHLVSILVPLRRGENAAVSRLDQAWSLAEQIDEPMRRLAVLAALAEWCWMTGVEDSRVTRAATDLPDGPTTGWGAGALLPWLRRLGLELPAVTVAEPFRLALDGRTADAASWWRRAGDPFLEAMSLADSAEEKGRVRAVTLLDRLGAVGTADRLRLDLRRDGVDGVPQRPRASTQANPAGLTNRQLDVARLVARGLSNAEIAARLYISPKTADHHVSAVLAKLDLPRRRAIVVQAEELGLT